MNRIQKAALFAKKKHEGQVRKYSGEQYIIHPLRVAGRVMLDENCNDLMIAAAWLHDVLEDTDATEEELREEFGDNITDIVIGLTNPSKGSKLKRHERKKMDRDHLAEQMKDVKTIKVYDRIDNLLDMDTKDSFTVLYCQESMALLEAIGSGIDEELAKELEKTIFTVEEKAYYA